MILFSTHLDTQSDLNNLFLDLCYFFQYAERDLCSFHKIQAPCSSSFLLLWRWYFLFSFTFPLEMLLISNEVQYALTLGRSKHFYIGKKKKSHFFLLFVLNYFKTATNSLNIQVSKIHAIVDLKRIPLWLSWEGFALRDSSLPCISVLLSCHIISPQYFAIIQKYICSAYTELRIRA